MRLKIALLFCFLISIALAFQNCSDSVDFSSDVSAAGTAQGNGLGTPDGTGSNDDDSGINNPVVCNPLNPEMNCGGDAETGLIGNLYYLTYTQHGAMFNNNLNNANLQDYRDFGVRVPINILMTSVNVPERSWDVGFTLPDGSLVKDENHQTLNEWFHLDMHGFIQMPAGSYQFGTISDDGVRITIDGQVVIENDTTHAPTWDCASSMVQFDGTEKKSIQVEYHQGPRNRIAMQFFYRPASQSNHSCGDNGGFTIVDALKLKNK